ncbi:MAG: PorT family protein [Sporocytophaga sp.]|nr:PorT family protein [Sporocytophaga sp.]
MKKAIISFWALTALFFSSYKTSAQSITGKLIGGINAGQVDGDDYAGFDKPGLVLGAAAAFPLSEKVFLQPEVFYSQKGAKNNENDPAYFRWRLNYIETPVVFHFRIVKRFGFDAGISPNFLLKSKMDLGTGYDDNTKDFDKVNLCLLGGVEFRIVRGLDINLRYSRSVMPINSKESSSYSRKFYTNTLSLSLRLTLNKVE